MIRAGAKKFFNSTAEPAAIGAKPKSKFKVMMDCYREWHTRYIVDIWKAHEREFPGVPGTQIEIGWRSPVPPPALYAARQSELRTWLALREKLDEARQLASCVSLHRHWLKDVDEEIQGWFNSRHLEYEADKLARLVSEHNIFDSEKDECRAVVRALREYCAALRWLEQAEPEAYEAAKDLVRASLRRLLRS